MKKLALAVTALALGFGACALPGRADTLTVTAWFEDVGDLAPTAPVMMADVTVGEVTDIELNGQRALVTMELDRSAGVPEGIIARVRRTSLLGERIVDLALPEDLPADPSLLRNGDTIGQTDIRADLEDLVREGTDVLAPIAASEVATLVDEGARGFGGKGDELRTLLGNFRAIVGAYSRRTDTIRGVITSLNRFNGTLAQQAQAHSRAVENQARAIRVLRDEIDRLEPAIRALNRLARGGRGILEAHSDEMGRFFRQMRTILGTLRSENRSIALFLKWAPGHNRNTQITEYTNFVQVYQDFIICGLNDDPSDPARRCLKEGS